MDNSLIDTIEFRPDGIYLIYPDETIILNIVKRRNITVSHTSLTYFINLNTEETRYKLKDRFRGNRNDIEYGIQYTTELTSIIYNFIDTTYDEMYKYLSQYPIPDRIKVNGKTQNRNLIGTAVNRYVERTIVPEEYVDIQIATMQLTIITMIANNPNLEDTGSLLVEWIHMTPVEEYYIDGEPSWFMPYFQHLKDTKHDDWEFYRKLAGLRRLRYYYIDIESGIGASLKYRLTLKVSSGLTLEALYMKLVSVVLMSNIDIEKTLHNGKTTELLLPLCYTASKAGVDKEDSGKYVPYGSTVEGVDSSYSNSLGLQYTLIDILLNDIEIPESSSFIEDYVDETNAFSSIPVEILNYAPRVINIGQKVTPYELFKYAIVNIPDLGNRIPTKITLGYFAELSKIVRDKLIKDNK